MNKPAPKEPSMDEILSSIRQIIADDDAAIAPKAFSPPAAAAPGAGSMTRPFPAMAAAAAIPAMTPRPPMPAPLASKPAMPEPLATLVPRLEREPAATEPLALTPEQILADDDGDDDGDGDGDSSVTSLSFDDILAAGDPAEDEPTGYTGEPQLVDPEDITFEPDDEPEPDAPQNSSLTVELPASAPSPVAARPAPAPEPRPNPVPLRPAASVAQAAPMPDPTLSADMAEQLLEPTTKSAVKHAFTRLSGLSAVGSGVTIEDMMREMLRPMLKDWLDENLPSIVERMVEKEIARISRGVD